MFQSGPKFSIGSFILADRKKVMFLQPFAYTLNVRLLVKWDWHCNGAHRSAFCVICDLQCGDEHKKTGYTTKFRRLTWEDNIQVHLTGIG
jgi:hypothetical protein